MANYFDYIALDEYDESGNTMNKREKVIIVNYKDLNI